MKIIKKFESKKNKVLLVQSPDGSLFVKKILPILSPAETNCKVCWLWTANARQGFGRRRNFIDMEYIEGCLFLDAFLSADTEQMSSLAQACGGFKDYARTFKGMFPPMSILGILFCGKANAMEWILKKNQGSLALCVAKAAALLYCTTPTKTKKAFCHALISLAGFSPYQLKTWWTRKSIFDFEKKQPITN